MWQIENVHKFEKLGHSNLAISVRLDLVSMKALWSTIQVGWSEEEKWLLFKNIDQMDLIFHVHVLGAYVDMYVENMKFLLSSLWPGELSTEVYTKDMKFLRSSLWPRGLYRDNDNTEQGWQWYRTGNSWSYRLFGIYAKWTDKYLRHTLISLMRCNVACSQASWNCPVVTYSSKILFISAKYTVYLSSCWNQDTIFNVSDI